MTQRFENIRLISEGGMARIFRAVDGETGGTVALKEVLDIPGASEKLRSQLVKRLEREARTLARLKHPNIVQYFGTATQDGRTYIVTEFLDGSTLEQEIMSGRIVGRKDRIMDVFIQLCSGMQYAHDKGVIHRDLKPANIFVLPGGMVKIIDFGIARIDDDVNLTLPEQILGTPHYMSPEQTAGSRDVDRRADLFSTGICLFHASTGQLPFDGKDRMQVTNSICSQPMPRGRMWPELEPIVERALAKQPGQRWQSFADLETALRSVSNVAEMNPAPEMLTDPTTQDPEPILQPVFVAEVRGLGFALDTRESPFQRDERETALDAATTPAALASWAAFAGAGFVLLLGIVMFAVGAWPVGILMLLTCAGLVVFGAIRASKGDGTAAVENAYPQGFGFVPIQPALFAPEPQVLQPEPIAYSAPPAPAVLPSMKRLELVIDGTTRMSGPSTDGTFRIGRAGDCSIVVDDPRVSTHHATVSLSADGRFVFSDHSTNGSYVGGQRVTQTTLASGEHIRIGSVSLAFLRPVYQ